MRRLALLFLLASMPGFGQSLLTIAPENCVWHAGDDPSSALHWAATGLDESGWSPYALWTFNLDQPRIWIRCHVDLSHLHATARPALQLSLRAAYQLFVNGRPAGAFGNMQTGNFTADFIRTFPLATPISAQGKSTIALRVLFRTDPDVQFNFVSIEPEARRTEWLAGDRQWLEDRRNSLAFIDGSQTLPTTIAFFIVGIAGLMMLGLYLSDRSRLEFIFFAFVCGSLAIRRILEQLLASLYPISLFEYRPLDQGVVLALICYVPLVYALARKPVPWFYRGVIGGCMIMPAMVMTSTVLPAAQSLRMIPVVQLTLTCANIFFGLAFLSPFAAFRPWRRITGSMRYMVAALMVLGVANELYIAFLLSRNLSLRSVIPFVNAWFPAVQQTRAILIIAAIVVLMALMFRDQRKTAEERAQLAGEMEAAREVQQQLVPASIPRIAGFHIAAAYLPAAEVGGDFYQVLPLKDGSALLVIGDVSGKGLKAAMSGTFALGVIRTLAEEESSPSLMLFRLNRQLAARSDGGFITCLIARISLDGTLTLANAGHLAPYLNGQEIPLASGLPLGIAPDAEFADSYMNLASGDQLTFLSDGVIEARNQAGVLFGFERTAAISTEPAEKITQAAKAFGQEDDITVLTLAYSPAEVLLA